jgi:hypothetical protein
MKIPIRAAALLLLPVTAISATDYSSAATVAATFECPESQSSDAARASSLRHFMSWIRGLHPDWSTPKITGYRLYLLERNHCEQTLAKIRTDPSSVR